MKNLLGCLIQYFKDLVKFKFNMNLKVYYYAQFKVSPGQEKVVAKCTHKLKSSPNLE